MAKVEKDKYYLMDKEDLKEIANAIRSRTYTSDSMTIDEIPEKIEEIKELEDANIFEEFLSQNASTYGTSLGLFHRDYIPYWTKNLDLSKALDIKAESLYFFRNNFGYIENIDICSTWITKDCTTLCSLFGQAQRNYSIKYLDTYPIRNWDTKKVTNLSYFVDGCFFDIIDVNWDLSNVTKISCFCSMSYTNCIQKIKFNDIGNYSNNANRQVDFNYFFGTSTGYIQNSPLTEVDLSGLGKNIIAKYFGRIYWPPGLKFLNASNIIAFQDKNAVASLKIPASATVIIANEEIKADWLELYPEPQYITKKEWESLLQIQTTEESINIRQGEQKILNISFNGGDPDLTYHNLIIETNSNNNISVIDKNIDYDNKLIEITIQANNEISLNNILFVNLIGKTYKNKSNICTYNINIVEGDE